MAPDLIQPILEYPKLGYYVRFTRWHMSAFEEHYKVSELAAMWKVHARTVARWLERYAELIPNFSTTTRRSRYGPIKRHYHLWRIPKSVAERMYRDMIGEE